MVKSRRRYILIGWVGGGLSLLVGEEEVHPYWSGRMKHNRIGWVTRLERESILSHMRLTSEKGGRGMGMVRIQVWVKVRVKLRLIIEAGAWGRAWGRITMTSYIVSDCG